MDANVLKALGDPHRFELLQMMADRSYCVRALARRSQLTASAELEAIRSAQRKPCDGPFYGCPESEYVRCKSYVPMEERDKTEDGTC